MLKLVPALKTDDYLLVCCLFYWLHNVLELRKRILQIEC